MGRHDLLFPVVALPNDDAAGAGGAVITNRFPGPKRHPLITNPLYFFGEVRLPGL
jgi:hypothetical protein